jgi:pyruvate dehydrogenase E1 component
MRRASGRDGVTLEAAFHPIFLAQGRRDLVLPQPHAAPGIDAVAFFDGRLSEKQQRHFCRELGGGGLPFYP